MKGRPTALGAGLALTVLAGAILWALITLLVLAAAAKAEPETPATFEGCQVTVRVNTGTSYVEATGLMSVFDSHEPGFEYAEMFGKVGERGTGKLTASTITPPLDITLISCPWRHRPAGFSDGGDGPRSDLIGPERSEGPPFARARHTQAPRTRGHGEDTPALCDISALSPASAPAQGAAAIKGRPRYGSDRTAP